MSSRHWFIPLTSMLTLLSSLLPLIALIGDNYRGTKLVSALARQMLADAFSMPP